MRKAWEMAKEETINGDWDVVILDEINNALAIERFPIDDVLPFGRSSRADRKSTPASTYGTDGRNAKPEIIEKADLVSEVQVVKHYYQEGVSAVLGLEY